MKEEAEKKRRSASSALFGAPTPRRSARSDFPPLQARCPRSAALKPLLMFCCMVLLAHTCQTSLHLARSC